MRIHLILTVFVYLALYSTAFTGFIDVITQVDLALGLWQPLRTTEAGPPPLHYLPSNFDRGITRRSCSIAMRLTNSTTLGTTLPIRVITYNIRYAADHRAPNEEPWPVRCPKLATQLRFATSGLESSFLCLQEVLHHQLEDLSSALGPRWAHIGQGRDGGEAGEYSPVFYQPEVWACEGWRTVWLSETPDVPSRGWDAVLNRIVTVGRFKHVFTGTRVVVMSTHFDHVGVKARERSAELVLSVVREAQKGDDEEGRPRPRPKLVVLGGDLNSLPDDPGYRTLTAPGSGMVDVRERVAEDARYGNECTYSSFGEPGEGPKRIDFLFAAGPPGDAAVAGVDVATYGVLANRFDDGVYISDHRPVVADLEIPIIRRHWS